MKRLLALMFCAMSLGVVAQFPLSPNAQLIQDIPEGYYISTEKVAVHEGGALDGMTTYRFYLECLNENDFVSAIFGDAINPMTLFCDSSWYNSPANALGTAAGVNPLFFSLIPELVYDSYFTIGASNSSEIPAADLNSTFADVDFLKEFQPDGGSNVVVDDDTGSVLFLLWPGIEYVGENQAFAQTDLKVMILQVTTSGDFVGQAAFQIFMNGSQDQEARGVLTFNSCSTVGCTDDSACNFDPCAITDDGSCSGDVDNDGICDDADDCIGALDECGICNGPGPVYACGCSALPADKCDCEGNVLDVIGVCGGDCISDVNNNGICDLEELENVSGEEFCGQGTIWDEATQLCLPLANPSDLNLDGCVDVQDFMGHLAAFGEGCNGNPQTTLWQCGDPVSYQGYDYETVQIGDQCWFAENLRTELYQNGDSIPMIYDNAAWLETEEGALCWHNNDSASWDFPGFLYNGYSVADERGVCPNSWHVASDADWIAVEISHGLSESEAQEFGQRGGSINLSQKMRDESWGQNQLGFAARRGGYRSYENGSFSGPLQSGAFWSNSNITTGYREFYQQWPGVARGEIGVSEGLSVRCIKDSE